MKGMHIVHTEASCGWGGQELRILSEASGLIGRGHRVTLLCPPESRIFAEATKFGVPVVALPIARKKLRGARALRAWLKAHRPDVVNTHSSTDAWLTALAGLGWKDAPPTVRTRHISAPTPTNGLTRWLYTQATRYIVTTGEKLRGELIARNGYPAAMITSVPTGIDDSRFGPADKAAARRALGLAEDAHYLGIVATLRSWKGHLHLLKAYAGLERPGWNLLVVGDGPMRGVLEDKARELGLADRVTFAGHREDPEQWLRAMDIFCLPSYANEGVPQAIVQAMLTALPIVTTPVGSICEAVEADASALVVPPQDPATLRLALQVMIDDPARAQALGAAARQRALANFTREAMLDRMEAIFRQLAEAGR
ncbi:glycosyltransferase family 4 protein [Denitratisoma oestradiolicum]|uniref:Glycosyl transferase family 1 n=1 Tax=Denitratisoma oestradiolicum TaxID=311182 RepID=A0A6S6XZH3_9PROT|nr:glycosyltransferase family 4 protein [Denitratisoma oestradiolicum]TWO79300.1 glycosyl transferase family 1 [Denitratisoma oestradiolicum]CAB1370373.1 Glycosyl transferase family 1 [Denitratisoma oestradiolicum]